MLQNILKLENIHVLDKKKQKSIIAGAQDPNQALYDKCRLYINGPNGGYWSDYVTYEQASSEWNGTEYSGGHTASGYCCASCLS